jgi:hypothetical protein
MMSEMARRLRDRKAKAEAAPTTQAPVAAADHDSSGGQPPEPAFKAPPAPPSKVTKTPNVAPSPATTPAVDTGTIRRLPGAGSESPLVAHKSVRVNVQSNHLPDLSAGSTTPNASEIESLKQELLTEMRRELQKIKDEIIEAIVAELHRK